MAWRELPPLITDVAQQLPAFPGVSLVAGRIADYAVDLWPEERPAVARAQIRRVQEFSTGRRLARYAMAELGMAAAAIPRADDRSPMWPATLKGSITHAGDVAVAAVARTDTVTGLGVDLERLNRVTERLHQKLFTPAECRRLLEHADPRLVDVLFSAKEAGYKAVNPQVGRYIGFQEAEVEVGWEDRTLRLRYVGEHEPNRLMDQGLGHFCFFEQYVLTVFIIP